MAMRIAKTTRRAALRGAAALGLAGAESLVMPAVAQSYPSRPVRIIVPFAAGGVTDILARLVGQWLSDRLGQPFIVENRPGGGTNIGTEAVVRAAPDGHTMLLVVPSNAINATLYDKLNFVFLRDIAPVASLIRVPSVIVVHPSVPATTLPAFIDYARSNPGKINMASAGNGSSPHLTGEMFKMMTGINLVHVPYRGGTQVHTDLIAGQVQVYFGVMPAMIEPVRAGKLRALAVTSATRSATLPDTPAAAEFLSGYEAISLYGFGVPMNTPVAVIDRLNKEVNAGLNDPKLRTRLEDLGGTVLATSPAEFGKLMAEETERWGRVVKFSGARLD
jgi:tripartite-type tricarboxylate transporter receptor subunit TctC